MDDKPVKHGLSYATFVILLILVSLGCLCLPSSIFPTSPSPTPLAPSGITVEPVQPTDTITTEVAQPDMETPVSNPADLNQSGPWLLIEAQEGLWAANPDGSGLTQITEEDYFLYVLERAVQPQGNSVIFLSPSEHYDFNHLAINMVSFPDGTITKITDLTSPETEAYAEQRYQGPLQAVRENHSFAWSPDGTRLAFVGLMDGPSADVYLYTPSSGDITLVSNNDAQDYWVSWSPDGNALFNFSAEGFLYGFNPTGVWIANGDGTDTSLLHVPEGRNDELVGWLDATTIVLKTRVGESGSLFLSLFDIVTTDEVILGDGNLLAAEVDSGRGAVMFADFSGLYLVTAEDHTPVLVSQDRLNWLDFIDPGEHYFTVDYMNGSLATYGTSEFDHQVSPIESSSHKLAVAMYGAIWGWTSEEDSQPGVWITGPGLEIGQISNTPARLPIWDEDNNLLFFAAAGGSGYDLYRTTFDSYYQDLAVVAHIDAEVFNIVWLGGQ